MSLSWNQRKVVTNSSSASSSSLPCSPVYQHKEFLKNTPIPKVISPTWRKGISTPLHEGGLSPNQVAVELLMGFSTGQIRMRGDTVEHIPTLGTDESMSIAEMLHQLDSPGSPKKNKTNDSVHHTQQTPVIGQKEPKTIARLQAEKNPKTRIPDLEICPENIIVGSPAYVPYKKIAKNQKGQGKFGKRLNFPISSSSAMPKRKHTLTHKKLVKAARAKKLTGTGTRAKSRKTTDFAKSKHVPWAGHVPCKGDGGGNPPTPPPPTGRIKKPKRHMPGIIALREISRFQKSVDLLIPFLSFGRVICEVTQDFKVSLQFQSSALMAIQEAAKTYLVNLFEAVNLCAIHRKCQTIAPKDFVLVKAIRHISAIDLWWV